MLVLGVCTVLGLMLHAGNPSDPSWWPGFLAFATWGLLPFLVFAEFAARLSHSRLSMFALFAGALVVTIGTASLLYESFVANTDAQNGIIFIILPLYQLAAMALFVAAAWGLSFRETSD